MINQKIQTMKNTLFISFLILLFFASGLSAQNERQYIRKGYNAYQDQEYRDAEVAFQKALNVDSASFEAAYNLACTYYQSEKYEQAQNTFARLTDAESKAELKADVYYNKANSRVKQAVKAITEKNKQAAVEFLKEAEEDYKQAMRIKPHDKEAKYNYMLTKELLKKLQNQQNQQNQQQQQNQNKEKKKEQDNKDQSNNEKDQKQDGKNNQKIQASEIDRKDAEMLLKIIAQKDQEILEKLKKEKAKRTKTKKEKDW